MKTRILIALMILIGMTSCFEKGETLQKLNGNENSLPDELKGLKVYTVGTGGGNEIKVAILNNQINSATYPVGKTQETTIIINNSKRVVYAKKIVMENDSLILIRK